MWSTNKLTRYLVRFLGLFAVLFYGTEAIIGLSAPEGSYSPFVAQYLEYISPFRHFLLLSVREVVSFAGYATEVTGPSVLAVAGGKGVQIGYDCIGYGVLSFWIAFVVANDGSWKKKTAWVVGGGLALIALNIARISLLLVAINRGWPIPLGWDHHTWFNIAAYALIFGMVWGYDKNEGQGRRREKAQGTRQK